MFRWVGNHQSVVRNAEISLLEIAIERAVKRCKQEFVILDKRIATLEGQLSAALLTEPQSRALLNAYRAMTEDPANDADLARAAEGLRREFKLFQEAPRG